MSFSLEYLMTDGESFSRSIDNVIYRMICLQHMSPNEKQNISRDLTLVLTNCPRQYR